MSDANTNPPAQAGTPIWVWIAVAAVVILVAVGGGYWFLKGHHKTAVAVKGHPLLGVLGNTVTDLDTTVPDADKMCSVALTRAMDFGVAPPGSTNVAFTIGAVAFGITVISALAAFSARETYRIAANDLGNPDAAPIEKQDYDRQRAASFAGAAPA